MAQFSAWLAGLFSTAPTRGLSGEDRRLSEVGPPGTFFHARLQRHESTDDFVDDPGLLWSTRSADGRRYGLREHLSEQRGEGDTAQFTDVIIILNERDHRRSLDRISEPWSDEAARALHREFVRYCDDEGFQILRTSRPVRFGLVVDGGSEMGGLKLGLGPGEFVTGLLPNFYTGPIAASRPVIGVHLNIPGAWEGYREVGTLFSDQLMFTVGNHGLDSFRHPALGEPGLYRLQQYLDGTFVHIVTPDGEADYHVSSDDESGGPSVLTIARHDGTPVAYLVLAVLDQTHASSMIQPPPPPAEEPPPTEVVIQESLTVDQPEMLNTRPMIEPPPPPLPTARASDSLTGHRTIVPDAVRERIFTFRERGALLQKVHFSRFMMGYDVFVTRNGQISTSTRSPAAVFQIRGRKVRLVVHDPELRLNGHHAELEKPLDLGAAALIEIAGAPLEYRDLSGVTAKGWPYLAEIRRPTGATHMVFGGRYRLGRDRRCKVRLPDDPHNGNIHWDPSRISGGTIRTRSGEVPQARFYTDSIMVASEHAELDLRDAPVMKNIARHCYSFVRRGAEIHVLYPKHVDAHADSRELSLKPGDEVLVGNCLFQVSYTRDEPVKPMVMTPSILANAADTEDVRDDATADVDVPAAAGLGEYGAPPEPPPPFQGIASYDSIIVEGAIRDVPAAAGLGEAGEAPPPPRPFTGISNFDSIIGERAMIESGLGDPDAPLMDTAEVENFLPGEVQPPPPVLPPAREPTVAAPEEIPAAPSADDTSDTVVCVDEDDWMVELARPGRLVLVGWMVAGDVIVGNHSDATVILPESRAEPDQSFQRRDYLRLTKLRGKRGSAALLSHSEASLSKDGHPAPMLERADGLTLEVIRRDIDNEEDFRIQLSLGEDIGLPDPRARLLSIDVNDRLVAALFTLGLPLQTPRRISLGAITADVLFDGQTLTLSGYLETYRTKTGFTPFFARRGVDSFRTVPEDGQPLALIPGDRLIVAGAIYEFQVP